MFKWVFVMFKWVFVKMYRDVRNEAMARMCIND